VDWSSGEDIQPSVMMSEIGLLPLIDKLKKLPLANVVTRQPHLDVNFVLHTHIPTVITLGLWIFGFGWHA
jgi:hypothetical protein